MKPLPEPRLHSDHDYFSLSLADDVLVVSVHNTPQVPSINYHALSGMFDAMRKLLTERQLTARGWSVIYDFSAVTGYEFTAAMAFPNFFRWARSNGRRKAAHIYPAGHASANAPLVKRLILGQVSPAGDDNDHYTAADLNDALFWIARCKDVASEKEQHT